MNNPPNLIVRKMANAVKAAMPPLVVVAVVLAWYPLHWLRIFFEQNQPAAQASGEAIKTIVVWGLLAAGSLFVVSLALAPSLKLAEKFDISSDWLWPMTLLTTAAVVVPVFFGVLAATHSRPEAWMFGGIAGAIALSVTEVMLRNNLSNLEGAKEFRPFTVYIEPRWHVFLLEHSAVNEERWREVRAELEDKRAVEPLYGDMNFTLLGPRLFYSNSSHYFFTRLPRISLDEIWRKEWMKNPDYFEDLFLSKFQPFGPKFDLRERYDHRMKCEVWEFSLVTDESWSRGDRGEYHDGESALIPLAVLPKEVFAYQYGMKLSKRRQLQLEKLVEQTGWKWEREWSVPELKHEYVWIRYCQI